jgi:2-(1,2-epoxy-1,2-dihydrophenyl)acetyl-CoA isomerase
MRSTVTAVCLALHRASKPAIAAVDGIAAGAGANLAFGCDLVLASDRARFSEIFIRRGLPIDSGGTWLLPRLIGLQKAKELAFFGDWVEAEEARALGLVNRVVPADRLLEEAREWAARLAEAAPAALAFVKQGLNRAFETPYTQALDDEAAALAYCARTPEALDAIRAFLEKRAPGR